MSVAITVGTSEENPTGKQPVHCFRRIGHWAVTPRWLNGRAAPVTRRAERYLVTHIPSGLSAAGFATLKAAKVACEYFAEHSPEDIASDPNLGTNKAALTRLKPVRDDAIVAGHAVERGRNPLRDISLDGDIYRDRINSRMRYSK